jgi:ankyrin repeat protein
MQAINPLDTELSPDQIEEVIEKLSEFYNLIAKNEKMDLEDSLKNLFSRNPDIVRGILSEKEAEIWSFKPFIHYILSQRGSISQLRQLIQLLNTHYRIEVNVKDEHNNNPLHILAVPLQENELSEKDLKELIKFLIEKGIPLDEKNIDGATPLYTAVDTCNQLFISLLLEAGKDTTFDFFTPVLESIPTLLFLAVACPKKEGIMELLLNTFKNMPINFQNKEGDTVLHEAIANDYPFVELLLQYGADPHLANQQNKTPLDLATEKKNSLLIELLNRYSFQNKLITFSTDLLFLTQSFT